MSKHFQLLKFLRLAPKDLLRAYCDRHSILQGFDWGISKHVPADRVAMALRSAGETENGQPLADFRAIWDLHGRGFTKGIMNEAQFHEDPIAYTTLHKLTHLGKAFWATLERPLWAANAKILSDVDKLPTGAWIKRGGLPARPGTVDQSIVAQLEEALVTFFTMEQHRGGSCMIDCLRRGDEEVFFTYAEDHPDAEQLWSDGKLRSQVLSRSFKLIFKHNDRRRTVEIYIEGDRTIVPDLQQIFARSVLGEEIAREAPSDDQIYDLSRLREPGFRFEYSANLGIADARVTKMRFRLDGEPWRRLMVEADNFKRREALDAMVAGVTAGLPKSRLVLDQVCINVLFHKKEGDRKASSRTFYITEPNSIRLKKDELGEKIAEMLVQSGIERPANIEPP